jgi:hypothetical protein
MKYMTPALLARFRSKDEGKAERAAAQWDQACRAYDQHLKRIRPNLPRAARSLLRRFSLHDAKVLMLALREAPLALSIFLELDTPRDEGLQLAYELVKDPAFVTHSALREAKAPLVWLYDEFEVQKTKGGPIFKHTILCANGWELQLSFREMRLARYKKVFFPTRDWLELDGAREGLESLLA